MIDLVLPVAVLIVSAIGAMIYTGYLGGATDIITAFSGCDAETSLIFATMVTVFFMLFLYLPRKVVTFKGFMDSLVDGFKLMIPAVTILIFAWSLKGVGDALGLADFVGHVAVSYTHLDVYKRQLRTNTALELMKQLKITVIRGNISEIKTLAEGSGTTKGVDADSADARCV